MKKFLEQRFGLDFTNLKGDMHGAIAAAFVAVPLTLVFGVKSGLGAAAGIYGAIFVGFFAALYGGSEPQVSGPTAPMTAVSVLVAGGILSVNGGRTEQALPAILGVFLLAGLMQIGLGYLKAGRYIRYFPYPVISGFMTGIGILILITQILPMLGYYPQEDKALIEEFMPRAEERLLARMLHEEAATDALVLKHIEATMDCATEIKPAEIRKEAAALAADYGAGAIGTFRVLGRALRDIWWRDLIMCVITILIVYWHYGSKFIIPGTLYSLVGVSLCAFLFLREYRRIDTIPVGFPAFHTDIFTHFNPGQILPYLVSAMVLALLGAIDSLLTAVTVDNMTDTEHHPDKELIGQGIGNSVAALFGGLPGAGTSIRTLTNMRFGGKTKLSGIFTGLLFLAGLLFLRDNAVEIPAAVSAGILITVGIGVIDAKSLRHIRRWPVHEAVVMLTVMVLTVFAGLVIAFMAGLILAVALFMKKVSDVVDRRPPVAPLNAIAREHSWADEDQVLDELTDAVYIKHLEGPLFFGFATRFQEMIDAMPEVRVVVIRMDKVPYVDQSGIYALETAVRGLRDRGVCVAFCGLNEQPKDMLERAHVVPGIVAWECCFENFDNLNVWLLTYLGRQWEVDKIRGERREE